MEEDRNVDGLKLKVGMWWNGFKQNDSKQLIKCENDKIQNY